jgi:starvation-inducible DNA-binding protein
MAKKALVETTIDLGAKVRTQMIDLLNQQLADTMDLYSQTKPAHWNVKGPEFMQLHEMFDTLARGLEGYVDEIAERATALGGIVKGTVRMASEGTRLPEYPLDALDGMKHVDCLVERYAALAATTRQAIDTAEEARDIGTTDLFTVMVRDLDKWRWFLEAHRQT